MKILLFETASGTFLLSKIVRIEKGITDLGYLLFIKADFEKTLKSFIFETQFVHK